MSVFQVTQEGVIKEGGRMKEAKRIIAIAVSILFLATAASPAFAAPWKRYTFDNLKFSIECPEGWNVRKLNPEALGEMVSVMLPENTKRSGFTAAMVIVSSVNEEKSLTLEHLYRMNVDAMASSSNFPGFKQENSYTIKLAGDDAYQTTVTYKHPTLGLKIKSFQIYTMRNNRLYVIQYAAPTSTYKKYMDDVNSIVRSFKPL
jgi:hypothetical protein